MKYFVQQSLSGVSYKGAVLKNHAQSRMFSSKELSHATMARSLLHHPRQKNDYV